MAAAKRKTTKTTKRVKDLKPRKAGSASIKGGGPVKKAAQQVAETVHNYRPPHYV